MWSQIAPPGAAAFAAAKGKERNSLRLLLQNIFPKHSGKKNRGEPQTASVGIFTLVLVVWTVAEIVRHGVTLWALAVLVYLVMEAKGLIRQEGKRKTSHYVLAEKQG